MTMPAVVTGRARRVVLGVGVVLAAATLTACGAEGETTGPESGVSVQEVQEPENFYEGDYLGQEVTVSATVTDVISPQSFVLAGADYGEDSLLVQTPTPVTVAKGQMVQVTGTVGQFHRLAESDYAPGTYDRYEQYETEAYLYDATVTPV
jgi:hypothetical protein